MLLDWVPGHFPTDVHGLGRFDGTALYEHPDPRRGFHKDWNTLIYDYGRPEIENYLVANGLYWLDKFHIDGLRVDAVASMLYLDYSRNHGEWEPNVHGGRENLEAMAFLKDTNERVGEYYPKATTHAEESTAFPDVSRPTYAGGLGFHFKWNMGWMHDTLHYMQEDPINRRYHQHHMTFGMVYAYSENFVLPLSHDEVVYGKGSLLGKMPGDEWQKFANLRAYFGFMWTHPGKKLIFMGGEFGQAGEWNHDRSLDWHLLEQDSHKGVQRLVRDLNTLYREIPALHELDCEPGGFEWVDTSNVEQSVIAFMRKDRDGKAVLGRLELHTRSAPRLYDRRSDRRKVARAAEHRCGNLRRLQCREYGRQEGRGPFRPWQAVFALAVAASARDHRPRPGGLRAATASARTAGAQARQTNGKRRRRDSRAHAVDADRLA